VVLINRESHLQTDVEKSRRYQKKKAECSESTCRRASRGGSYEKSNVPLQGITVGWRSACRGDVSVERGGSKGYRFRGGVCVQACVSSQCSVLQTEE